MRKKTRLRKTRGKGMDLKAKNCKKKYILDLQFTYGKKKIDVGLKKTVRRYLVGWGGAG